MFSIVIIALVWNIIAVSYMEARDKMKAHLGHDSLLVGEWIRSRVDSASYLLGDINAHVNADELIHPPQDETKYLKRRAFLDRKRQTLPDAVLTGLFDKDCYLVNSSFLADFDASDREYCTKSKNAEQGTTIVSNAFTASQGSKNITIARSFDFGTDEFEGMSAVAIELSFFDALIDKLEYETSSLVAIFDENMILLGRYPNLPDVIGTHVNQKEAAEFLQQSDETITYIDVKSPVDGVYRLYVLRKVEGLPFLIVIGHTREFWLEGYTRRITVMLLLTGLLLLFGFILLKSNLSIHTQSKLLKGMKEKAERDARMDPLTGLDNRRSFYEIGETEFNRQKRYGVDLCLLILDLDHFKQVNDEFGHVVGDTALVNVAESIQKTLRSTDFSFRLGGEEFAVLLPETNLGKARIFAERLRLTIEDESTRSEGLPTCTASIGLCQAEVDMDTFQSMVRKADGAMYEAKDQGRNKVVAR
jgi:diguanylate cyclase (GGDEF)-like protein